mmetsp:Transcript_123999/g.246909  ORF Transcript_123999/g.246909 Transcript_123999/m.246909 type:complete len:400 (+) Transcript_123999:69-1268(+)
MARRLAPAVLRPFCGLHKRQNLCGLPGFISGGNKLRFLSRAADLSADMEHKLASGVKLDSNGTTYALVVSELDRLRWANDKIAAQVAALKDVRTGSLAAQEAMYQSVLDGDAKTQGPALIDVLAKIEDVESQIAGCRSEQLQNSKDIGNLKRCKARIEKSAEVRTLIEKVDDALRDGDALMQKEALVKALSELLERLHEEFDRNSKVSLALRQDTENIRAKLGSLVLAKRVRRGRMDVETELLGGRLISSFYSMLRKNSRLQRVRDVQLEVTMDVSLLEHAMGRLKKCAKVQEVINSGDRKKMEVEVQELLEELKQATRALAEVEATWSGHSDDASRTIEKLRAPGFKDQVSKATGEMREDLFQALREEELCSARMASLRRTKARDVTLLCRLRAALQQ